MTMRTDYCGELRADDIGREVTVCGWVDTRRVHSEFLAFIDLRDHTGVIQCVVDEKLDLRSEYVVAITGTVRARMEGKTNENLATGGVEIGDATVVVLAQAEPPPFPMHERTDVDETIRLRHRYIDLRKPRMQRNLRTRARVNSAIRSAMERQRFVEIETPMLIASTPEGARDFVVPSRLHPGEFYALPQSPQIYKQILMTAGFDRYLQIARCFRDEDLRADRQPEFTQIDVEASFIEPDDIFGWMEEVMVELGRVAGVEVAAPFPRFTWAEMMDRFASDRPDLRYPLEIQDWSVALGDVESPILKGGVAAGGRIRGLLLEGGAQLSRREVEALEGAAKAAGAPGLLWAKRTGEGISGSLARFLTDGMAAELSLGEGDLALVAVGPDRVTSPALSAVRGAAVAALGIPRSREHAWAWVLDFPLFETMEDGSLAPGHHPFVLPHPEDMGLLETDPGRARGLAYDLVYNGSELGSGSLRIHEAALQRRIFQILGMDGDEIGRKFGFLLEALESGAPPHGGIALGVDRMVKEFTGAGSLRDVIAFPKTTAARALFEGAPTVVAPRDLQDLHIRTAEKGGAAPAAPPDAAT